MLSLSYIQKWFHFQWKKERNKYLIKITLASSKEPIALLTKFPEQRPNLVIVLIRSYLSLIARRNKNALLTKALILGGNFFYEFIDIKGEYYRPVTRYNISAPQTHISIFR